MLKRTETSQKVKVFGKIAKIWIFPQFSLKN